MDTQARMCGKNGTGTHVSDYTPLGTYNNIRKGVGCVSYLAGGGVHMVTLYWGPVSLMGMASGTNLRRSISVYRYAVYVCSGVWLCACCVLRVCVSVCVRVCVCMRVCLCVCASVWLCAWRVACMCVPALVSKVSLIRAKLITRICCLFIPTSTCMKTLSLLGELGAPPRRGRLHAFSKIRCM